MKSHHKKHITVFAYFIMAIILAGLVLSVLQLRSINNLNTKAAVSDSALKDCFVDESKMIITPEEQLMLDRINSYRLENGLISLDWSDELIRSASWMSDDMLKNNYLEHTDSLGRDVPARVVDCGYAGYLAVGENLDSGSDQSGLAFEAWKQSPAHNANLLGVDFTEAGVSLESLPDQNSHYWTVNFGNRTPIPSPTQLIPSTTITPDITSAPSGMLTPINSPTTSVPSPTQTLEPTLPPLPTVHITVTPGPSPTPHPDYVPNPLDMQILIRAGVAGIGADGNQNPRHFTRHVRISIHDASNKQIATGNGFITYDGVKLFNGIMHLGQVPNGVYFVKIIADNMLQTIVQPTFQVLDSGRLNVLPEVNFLQGDIDSNNTVDIKDYNSSLNCFQQKRCPKVELIDFSDDGIADIVDYNILLHVFWETLGD